jgi:glycosyltransferase involved in cell wall biosynthesis
VVFISGGEGGGGVLSLMRQLSPSVACQLDERVIHLGLVNLPLKPSFAPPNFAVDSLYVHPHESGAAKRVIVKLDRWLKRVNPSIVFLNDVSQIEEHLPQISREVKVVFVLHDEGADYTRPVYKYSDRLDAVVVVAEYLSNLLVKNCPRLGNKITTIHNGVRFPLLESGSGEREITANRVRILYAGGIDRFKKGVQDLPRLAIALKQRRISFNLTIAGGKDEKLERRFRRLQVENSIHWAGKLPWKKLLELMSVSDIFFLPSRCEPFGLVTVEAMGMGCLPIAYDIESGSREIISDGDDGWLVGFKRIDEVARVIEIVSKTNKFALQRMRQAALNKARRKFSMESSAVAYAQLIRQITRIPTDANSQPANSLSIQPNKTECPFNEIAYQIKKQTIRPLARLIAHHYHGLVQPVWRNF